MSRQEVGSRCLEWPYLPTWFDASEEERAAITRAIDRGRELIEGRHHPDGFDIGANVGEAAGQTAW